MFLEIYWKESGELGLIYQTRMNEWMNEWTRLPKGPLDMQNIIFKTEDKTDIFGLSAPGSFKLQVIDNEPMRVVTQQLIITSKPEVWTTDVSKVSWLCQAALLVCFFVMTVD